MTTDTKAVARWDAGSGVNPRVNGKYVLFTDHERVVDDFMAERAKNLELFRAADANIANLRAELAAKSKDVADLQEVLTSIQEYASSLEYMGKWANAEYGDRCRHKIAREIQEIMGEGNGR